MPTSTEDPGLAPRDELVAAIVGFGGPLASIVVHMVHNGASQESLGDVLSGLLASILEPLDRSYTGEQLRSTAQVLEDTTTIMCREILIVPGAPRSARRTRSRRRSGGRT